MTTLPATELTSDAALERRRVALRRGLARANTAAIVISLIVIGLAVTAIMQAVKARRHATEAEAQARYAQLNARRAQIATQRAEEELWKANLAHARAARTSDRMGRRAESLESLKAAAAMRPSLELRNEAISALALLDAREELFHPANLNKASPLAFDPTLERYAVAASPGGIEICRVSDSTVEKTLQGPSRRITRLCFSPDGALLAARFATGRRIVWQVLDARAVVDVKFDAAENQDTLTFSRDSQWLATSAPGGFVHLFKRGTPGEIWKAREPLALEKLPQQFALDARGERLALAIQNDLEIRRIDDGSLATTLTFHKGIREVRWHPDGQACAVGLLNGDIMFWNLASTNATILAGHTGRITQLAFSQRGDWLLSGSEDGSTRLWRPVSRQMVWMTRQGLGTEFSQDDRRIAFIRPGEGFGLWELQGSSEFRTTILPDSGETATRTVDFSPDGRWLVATSPRHLTLWNVADEQPPHLLPVTDCFSAHFSADGKAIISTSARGIEMWTIGTMGTPSSGADPVLKEPQLLVARERTRRASVTRGSHEWLAVSGRPATILDLSHPAEAREVPVLGHQEFVALSPDGNWLACSANRADGVHIRRLETGAQEHLLEARGGPLAFRGSGDLLVVGSSHEFAAFDTTAWTNRWRLRRDAQVDVGGASAFSRDGATLALNVQRDRVRLVAPETGQELATLVAPVPRNIAGIAFNQNGDFLAARAEGREIQVWNLREIRRQLANMGLNLPDQSGTSAQTDASSETHGMETNADVSPSVVVSAANHLGSDPPWPVALPLAGAALAVGFGLYTFGYQRRLMRSYDEVERLVAERNSALQQAQTELWQSQKMKALGTMAAGIAHDFNNLLSVIRLSNDFLGRGVKGDPNLVEETEAIEAAVHQGKAVVESMLGYSRTQAGEPRLLDIPEVVEETLGLLNHQFLSGTRLTVALDRNVSTVLLSRDRLVQIILNLIVNASEAMNGSGRLAITVRELPSLPKIALVLAPRSAHSYVEIVIADEGPGIPPEVLPRIFEPFFTTKLTGNTRGTGLGLSMIYAAAKADQLGLAVETVVGTGTTFHLFAPVDPHVATTEVRPGRAVDNSDSSLQSPPANDRNENAN